MHVLESMLVEALRTFKNVQIFIPVGGENPELVVLVLELQMVSLWHSNLKIWLIVI